MSKFISVSYSVAGQFGVDGDFDDAINCFMEEHGLEETGSGSGFGQRDMSFDGDDDDIAAAEADKGNLIAELESLGSSEIVFDVIEYEDEDEDED